MKHLLLGLAACSLSLASVAQTRPHCGTDLMRRRLIEQDPTYLQREAEYQQEIRQLILDNAEARGGDVVITIPLVFHIVHLRGVENISNEQILNQVELLNQDYRKLNPDIGEVIPAFTDIAGDAHIQFKLATIDPYGNCTNGIDRVHSIETLVGNDGSKLRVWPRGKYLNVWVVRSMRDGVAGYAYYPGAASPLADGIIILQDYIGEIGTSNENSSTALTHEIGHSLNLPHVWGSTNDPGVACGDEGVEDTPITKGYDYCPSPQGSKICDPEVFENYQNYMDYSYCSMMFTNGQIERMRAALANNTSERSNLGTQANLEATGVAEGFERSCSPIADFYAVVGTNLNQPVVPFVPASCTGTSVRFMDNSVRAFPETWSWSFQDGEPSTSSDRNPTVTFTTAGWKRVTLTVGNAQGTNSKTDDYAVLIGNSEQEGPVGLYNESFEVNEGIFPMFEMNHDENGTFFQAYTNGGHSGTKCAWLNSGSRNPLDFIDPSGDQDIDDLVSPNMDLSGFQSAQFTFWYSYSTMTTNLDTVSEKLEISSSTDCGRTWQVRTTIQGEDLVTNGNIIAGPGAWVQRSITLPGSVLTDNVRIRFRYHSSEFSNDLFIDDLNISGSVGIETMDGNTLLNVFPNPSNDAFAIQAFGMDRSTTEVVVTDMRGAVVFSNRYAPLGGAGITLSSRELGMADGLYMLRVSNEAGTSTQKLIVGR